VNGVKSLIKTVEMRTTLLTTMLSKIKNSTTKHKLDRKA
jgi:hypothetical protein